MIGKIHSLESFGTVDGPGTRFVVFVKGCPMRCQYCHNPDTWEMTGAKEMTVEEILAKYESTKEFYRNGGLTVTGGEPLVQIDFVTELFEQAAGKGIHTCLDTSGIMFRPEDPVLMEKYDRLMQVTSLVMLDIKHIDDAEHRKLTGQPNGNILAFARYLNEKQVPMWIRHVVVPGITDKEEYLVRLGEFMAELDNVKALDVLPYHTMGIVKYENLGMEYPLKGVPPLSKEEAIKARNTILRAYKVHHVKKTSEK
ncbi:MAG: pyruvate formate lyase-activating protein [Lachnospiraceae bacterium]|nr:pyruvate formate lyase-activating protein [Lachnospiraceae bacterium]